MKTVLINPVITEKSMTLAKSGAFSFFVNKNASKGAIENAVKNQFGVTVTAVKTLKTYGKIKRAVTKSRRTYQSPGLKKALVFLETGQKIPIFDLEEKRGKSKKKVIKKNNN
jgi:large subunit ribosomal protein L23